MMKMGWLVGVLFGVASPQEELKPGLIGEYFTLEGEVEDFPALPADKKPLLRRIDSQLNWEATPEKFAGTDLSTHFYVRWTGLLRVPKDAKYTFFTESDDGSRLFVEGKLVVNNGGLHSMEEKSGEVQLKAGEYEIKVDLFQNEGEAGIKLSWEAPNLPREMLPGTVLFHRKDKDLDR